MLNEAAANDEAKRNGSPAHEPRGINHARFPILKRTANDTSDVLFLRRRWFQSESCGGLQPADHLLRVDEAGLLLDEAAVRKDCEVGDASDVITGGELWVGFGIHFEDDAFAGDLAGGAFDMRRGHAAGTAPRGPEVDEHGNACVIDDVIEEGAV